jgi:tRNA(fMet)-specific endonuclease VapC
MMHLDTSFLVDLLREGGRDHAGPASGLLRELTSEELRLSVHVVCELQAGVERSRRPSAERQRVQQLCRGLAIVYPDDRFPSVYARLLASQERTRQRIATMDLLIATAAVLDEAPLVTRNARDFARVPGLELVGY